MENPACQKKGFISSLLGRSKHFLAKFPGVLSGLLQPVFDSIVLVCSMLKLTLLSFVQEVALCPWLMENMIWIVMRTQLGSICDNKSM